ncbi:MAG: calcium-binding protein [Janthinobacterium lividum]
MATTSWIGGSGDWNMAANWSAGVPTAADDAVIGGGTAQRNETITGGGTARSLDIGPDRSVYRVTLAGTYALGSFLDDQVIATLAPGAALSFGAGTVTDGGRLTLQAGATLGTGVLTLDNGVLDGVAGALANPVLLPALGVIALGGTGGAATTLGGGISGPGTLRLGGSVVLTNQGNSFSGGLDAEGSRLELAGPGTGGVPGPMLLGGGTLVLDPGVVVGPITAYAGSPRIDATDQAVTVFVHTAGLLYENGGGRANIVGATDPDTAATPYPESLPAFGSFTVQGGTGSVTVSGGNNSGAFYGGSAGGNVIIAGPDLPGYTPAYLYTNAEGQGFATAGPLAPVTIVGGGDGDVLVATGTDNLYGSNLVIASAGNETLSGSGGSASNVFFGGSGADVIAGGSGPSVIVAGSGAATISGGDGTAAIFAGAGPAVLLGGAGADYVQVGSGQASLFTGAGADLIGVVNGAGGSLVVSGFRVGTDHVSALGYAAGPTVTATAGGTVLGFSDSTQVTLLGVASLPPSAYS